MNALFSIDAFLFGENIYYGGGRYGPITQAQLEFVLFQNGAAEVDVDGRRYHLHEGCAALVLTRYCLCYDYREGVDTRVVWCEATLPPSFEELDVLLSPQPIGLPVSRRMLDLHRMGMELGLVSDEIGEQLRTALGRALFQEYMYQAHRRTRDRPMHRAVIRAKEYIEQNICEPCTLSDIAAYCNITPQHLTRIFKRDIGQTPMEYLWALRTKQGAQMLHRSGLSVAEIAYRCGYENANHFSRRIKEQFGVPPTVLRQRRWQR